MVRPPFVPCLVAVIAVSVLAGCAAGFMTPPQPGQTGAQVLQRFGPPTTRYALPAGAERLEYASGPFGRETWMIDVDARGAVVAVRQVLTEASLADFQRSGPGMARDELLRTLGRPGHVRGGGWQGGEVWSWRYVTNDCLWFQVSLGDDGRVRDGSFGIDPACDKDDHRK